MKARSFSVLVTLLLSVIILISCGQQHAQPTDDTQENNALQNTNMDFDTPAGTDFFRYANGGWMKNNPILEVKPKPRKVRGPGRQSSKDVVNTHGCALFLTDRNGKTQRIIN